MWSATSQTWSHLVQDGKARSTIDQAACNKMGICSNKKSVLDHQAAFLSDPTSCFVSALRDPSCCLWGSRVTQVGPWDLLEDADSAEPSPQNFKHHMTNVQIPLTRPTLMRYVATNPLSSTHTGKNGSSTYRSGLFYATMCRFKPPRTDERSLRGHLEVSFHIQLWRSRQLE
jgi:hypothetical protein